MERQCNPSPFFSNKATHICSYIHINRSLVNSIIQACTEYPSIHVKADSAGDMHVLWLGISVQTWHFPSSKLLFLQILFFSSDEQTHRSQRLACPCQSELETIPCGSNSPFMTIVSMLLISKSGACATFLHVRGLTVET